MGKRVIVTGAGGFIGGHLVRRLEQLGHDAIGIDIKPYEDWWQLPAGTTYVRGDVRDGGWARKIMEVVDPHWVFALAADMGGMGFISNNDEQILRNNLKINLETYEAAKLVYERGTLEKYFFSSSVCVYPEHLQMRGDFQRDMKEEYAYPANPQDAYGWEKLITERLLMVAHQDLGFPTYIARFHNCYGPHGTWRGGREKAPAALCRKAVQAVLAGPPYEIEVWGDGRQIRPFIYVDDLVEGILELIQTDCHEPVNLGPFSGWAGDTVISINELVNVIMNTAGAVPYDILNVDGPEGVRYRGANGGKMWGLTGWTPTTPLAEGIKKTYDWIEGLLSWEYVRGQDDQR